MAPPPSILRTPQIRKRRVKKLQRRMNGATYFLLIFSSPSYLYWKKRKQEKQMNSILNSCHDLQKKQIVMQDSQLEKLNQFKELLQTHKDLLSSSKSCLFFTLSLFQY